MYEIENSRICFGSYYEHLKGNTTIKPVEVEIKKFADNEISVYFQESLRGKHLFIFGETTHNLTELLLTIDAASRSSVKEITVVLPYYGYSRQDKREGNRGCLGASMIAQVLQSMGINRIMTIDLHADQIQGYFRGIPVEHINGVNIFVPDVQEFKESLIKDFNFTRQDTVIVAPDAGGTVRAGRFADRLRLPLVTIDKRRKQAGVVDSMKLMGNVEGKNVIIVDDIADSCGTLKKAVDLLKTVGGARAVIAVATHPVLSPKAKINLEESKLDGLIVSDTLKTNLIIENPDLVIRTASCSWVLDDAMNCVAEGKSLSHLTSF